MKEYPNKRLVIWDVCYPIVIYLIVFNVSFFIMALLFGSSLDYMMKQVAVEALCFPLVMHFYKKSPIIARTRKIKGSHMVYGMIAAASFGVALNNLIALTPLKTSSSSFTQVNELFYGSTLMIEILAAGILAPLVEEVLYRGVVFKRLRDGFGSTTAIIVSAILFGVLHFNVVQMVFAIPMGLIFAYAVECTGHLEAAILGHMAVNVISLITSETGAATWMFTHTIPNLCISSLGILIGAGALYALHKIHLEQTECGIME